MANGSKYARFGATPACVLWVLGTVLAGTAGAQPEDAARVLQEGRAYTTSHSASERFSYVVDALESHTYLVSVDQQGFDFVVTVESPDGRTRSFDSPLRRDEREVVLIEDAAAGAYTVTVHTEEHTGAAAAHSIRLADLSAAEAAVIEAWRSMSRGAAASFESGAQGWADAVAAYEAAAASWGELGGTRERAHALFAVATLEYWQLYNWQRSADLAADAAALYESLDRAALAANALHLQGAALVESALETTDSEVSSGARTADDKFEQALSLLEQARRTHERLGNVYELGLVVNNLGYTHYNRGRLDEARTYWDEAANLMRSADERAGEVNPIANLAVLDAEAGRVASAIDSFERVLGILPDGEQQSYRANTLDNLGTSHLMFGDADEALRAFNSALSIQREIEDLQGRGRSLRGVGRTYHSLGQLDLAKTYLREALSIARQTNDGRNQEGILRDLGNIAYLEEDYTGALELHREALDIVQSESDESYLELLVAKDLIALGRHDEAHSIAARTLEAAEQSGSELLLAEALHELGRAQRRDTDSGDGLEHLERARAIYERLDLQAQHAQVLHSLALAARDRGQLQQAVEYGEASLDRLEQLRLRVASPELRAYFSSIRRDYYESQIAVLMALARSSGDSGSRLQAALETSERARARMITDLLQEASIDVRADVDADVRQRQTALYERLAELGRERERLLEAQQAPGETDGRRSLDDVLAEIASVENELNLLDVRLRDESPAFASLSPPEPLAASRMQALLDEDSVLLQYAFAEQTGYAWVVSPDAIRAVELGDRTVVERAARSVVEGLNSYAPSRSAAQALEDDMRALADIVLAPLLEHVDARRIVLSLDGALAYVPFSALPLEQADGTRQRLLEAHEVVRVPSMSALAGMRGRRDAPRSGSTLAVFADPVLDTQDARLGGARGLAGAAEPESGEAGTRAYADANFQRLPSTAHEADVISSLVPEQQRFVATGFDASRGTVLQSDLREYRYVHFATHGFVNARHPALSGLAMSRFDAQGVPQDGFLRLHDIYDMRLDADLVVLSACETALGRDVRGEGLVGLSQGFMYAGARGLVASLWQVPDRATSELMTRLYSFMLDDGLGPAAALRKAQLAVAAERRWSNPYFWGGFVLLGDWR